MLSDGVCRIIVVICPIWRRRHFFGRIRLVNRTASKPHPLRRGRHVSGTRCISGPDGAVNLPCTHRALLRHASDTHVQCQEQAGMSRSTALPLWRVKGISCTEASPHAFWQSESRIGFEPCINGTAGRNHVGRAIVSYEIRNSNDSACWLNPR